MRSPNHTLQICSWNDINISNIFYSGIKQKQLLKKITSSLKSGGRILHKSFRPEKRIQGDIQTIIHTIHEERFSAKQSYCITGGHFSDLYVRNSGIFYNALLDGRIALDAHDWNNRVEIALRTTESILRALRSCGKLYTTFAFEKNGSIVGTNYYTEPSDSLHGLLWNFCAFRDDGFIAHIFPTDDIDISYRITEVQREKMNMLRSEYKKEIEKEFRRYSDYCLSQRNHRVSKRIFLASARDGVKRRSSFYDNVIYWRTAHMMHILGFQTAISLEKLLKIKQTLLDTFWNEEKGIFFDDLHKNSLESGYFCADSLIVITTQFLCPDIPQERVYLEKIVDHIQKNNLDKPFGIHYSEKRTNRHWPIILGAPYYADYTIWSHWSTEYIKLLILLGNNNSPQRHEYFSRAKKHLEMLEEKIYEYGGYPELYDLKGNIYKSRLYRSVLRCSWVVGYEQARYMFDKITQ